MLPLRVVRVPGCQTNRSIGMPWGVTVMATAPRAGTHTGYTSTGSFSESRRASIDWLVPVRRRGGTRGRPARPSSHRMSSLGSSGSVGGAGRRSAAARSSAPQPVEMSQPGRCRSRADRRRTSATWSGVSLGRSAMTHAAAAATSGAEKLVPSTRE